MDMKNDPYASLRRLLKKQKWPRIYMFKFIVPPEQVDKVKELFGPADITTKKSKKGNYVSVTGKEMMISSEKVIERYKEASKIEGLMAL